MSQSTQWKSIATFNESEELTWQPFAALIESAASNEPSAELEGATFQVTDQIFD
jgi:hypothetical protein